VQKRGIDFQAAGGGKGGGGGEEPDFFKGGNETGRVVEKEKGFELEMNPM